MKHAPKFLHVFLRGSRVLAAAFALASASLFVAPAQAETGANVSPVALQQALSAAHPFELYNDNHKSGFNLSSSYFSGLASGVTTSDSIADMNNEQRLYALLIDGRYDFNHDAATLSSSAKLHPYVSAGMGMATTGQSANSNGTLLSQSGNAVPLFRLGGGVAYRLDQRWNLSLNYQAGMATPTGGDQVFTGRNQQAVDMQQLNIGMNFAF